jgi:aryl-alcohol dehydrogenase-like predicted oxidoreductase
MEYINTLGFPCSRLVVGTVQFGMPYGINNRTGQPSRSDVKEILSVAFDGGVNVLDTAYAYGDSEAVIGEVLASLSPPQDLVIVTKLRPIPVDQRFTATELRAEVEASIHSSLERLRVETIPIYLMHRAEHLTAFGGSIVEELLRLRELGLVQHIGVSIYTAQQAEQALDTEGIEAIQVPFNVFDQRLVHSGFFDGAAAQGVAVFIRSVYLKGLVVMDIGDVPDGLKDAVPFKGQLNHICSRFGRTVVETALKYPLSLSQNTCVLTGVEQLSQMTDNLALFDRPALPKEMVSEIQAAFGEVPVRILNPSLWPE